VADPGGGQLHASDVPFSTPQEEWDAIVDLSSAYVQSGIDPHTAAWEPCRAGTGGLEGKEGGRGRECECEARAVSADCVVMFWCVILSMNAQQFDAEPEPECMA